MLRILLKEYFKKQKKEGKNKMSKFEKMELLDAVIYAYGFTKREALEYIKKASNKTKQNIIKGFKQDAIKNFYE